MFHQWQVYSVTLVCQEMICGLTKVLAEMLKVKVIIQLMLLLLESARLNGIDRNDYDIYVYITQHDFTIVNVFSVQIQTVKPNKTPSALCYIQGGFTHVLMIR